MKKQRLFTAGVAITAIGGVLLVLATLLLDPATASSSVKTAVNVAYLASHLGLILVVTAAVRHFGKAFKLLKK